MLAARPGLAIRVHPARTARRRSQAPLERKEFAPNCALHEYLRRLDSTTAAVQSLQSYLADIEARILRLIGDPETRYREDPVRMLRAVRFAARFGFAIEPATMRAISPVAGAAAAMAMSSVSVVTNSLRLRRRR